MSVTWDSFLRGGVTAEAEASLALRQIPPADAAFFKAEVLPQIPKMRIQAIKAVRGRYNVGLRSAKVLVDALANGATIHVVDVRCASPDLIDVIQAMEDHCRDAIRKAVGDEKAMTALTGIRQQVADLWLELIELPSPAPSDR